MDDAPAGHQLMPGTKRRPRFGPRTRILLLKINEESSHEEPTSFRRFGGGLCYVGGRDRPSGSVGLDGRLLPKERLLPKSWMLSKSRWLLPESRRLLPKSWLLPEGRRMLPKGRLLSEGRRRLLPKGWLLPEGWRMLPKRRLLPEGRLLLQPQHQPARLAVCCEMQTVL